MSPCALRWPPCTLTTPPPPQYARYVPFGSRIQDYLVTLGLGWCVPHYGWQQGSVNLDEAFVTPLVVTQAVNLVLETFVPYVPQLLGADPGSRLLTALSSRSCAATQVLAAQSGQARRENPQAGEECCGHHRAVLGVGVEHGGRQGGG